MKPSVFVISSEFERIGAIYRFVRDEIAFGYNQRDDLPASRILGSWLYRHLVRHLMNRKVARIRAAGC
ncbi:MAG: hypothetical protein Q8O34_00025 [Rhodocyclaceae bacterium]|nr:hypothetical protein [Rhodocyclaceae bacterium]